MSKKNTASPLDIEERNRLLEKASTLNQSLLPSSNQADLKPRIYFHIRKDSQRTKAQLANELAMRANVVVPGIQRLDVGPQVTELRYFKKAEEQEAKQISEVLSILGLKVETKYVTGYESSTTAGGYLAEIARMNLEVREYLSLHPGELKEQAA